MLTLCLISPCPVDFNVNTPFERPLGGSESGLSYLAIELARLGHDVSLVSNTSAPGEHRGVRCFGLDALCVEFFAARSFDGIVVLNYTDAAVRLKEVLPRKTPKVLWTGNAANFPIMDPLYYPEVRESWDFIVMVSQWHRAQCTRFFLDPTRCRVLNNAISPVFEGLFADLEGLRRAKPLDPVCAYTSVPNRGLELLCSVFPTIRQRFPRATLKVFSSMAVYQQTDDPSLQSTFQRLRAIEGVDYRGAVRQPELARELMTTTVLTYTNTVAEAGPIAIMEAMASGCFVVTSEYGAMPETTNGFARLIPVAFQTAESYAGAYRESLAEVLRDLDSDREQVLWHLWMQCQFANQHYTWGRRAQEWTEFLAPLGRPR